MKTADEKRIEKLKSDLDFLERAEKELTPAKRTYFMLGYCYGRYDDDIIYQICVVSHRNPIDEIRSFLKRANYQ